MFVGRARELQKLEEMYAGGHFEFAVVYGRRRVGKTTLITKFCEDKRTIFFPSLESNAQANLAAFSRAFYRLISPGATDAPVYGSFTQIFEQVGAMARSQRLVLAIDEYPWLALADESVSSALQICIDHIFKNTKLFLILCGSSMSFMENQVLGHKSPLYGRRTAQFRIAPLTYRESACFHPARPLTERALIYGMTGGVPSYVERFDADSPLEDEIVSRFFDPNSYLFEEPANLLKQELREPRTYNAIIAAVAGGASRLNEIATKTGVEGGVCAQYLSTLAELGIVKKERPVAEKSARKTLYSIEDLMFRFWYRFIPANLAMIQAGRGRAAYEQAVRPHLQAYMGAVFERMCREFILNYYEPLPFSVSEIGRWWGTDPAKREQAEIDIVALAGDGARAIFCECKYSDNPIGRSVAELLIERSKLLGGVREAFYILFSKSGFSMTAAGFSNLALLRLDEMY